MTTILIIFVVCSICLNVYQYYKNLQITGKWVRTRKEYFICKRCGSSNICRVPKDVPVYKIPEFYRDGFKCFECGSSNLHHYTLLDW